MGLWSVRGGRPGRRRGTEGGCHGFSLEKREGGIAGLLSGESCEGGEPFRKCRFSPTLMTLELPKRHADLMVPYPVLRCVTPSFFFFCQLVHPPALPTWMSHSRCVSHAAVNEKGPGPCLPVQTPGQGAPARSPSPLPVLAPDAGPPSTTAGPRRLVPLPRSRALPCWLLLHRNAPAIPAR